jgi:hypothetical protein
MLTSIVSYIRYVGFLINKHGLPLVLSRTFHDTQTQGTQAARYGNVLLLPLKETLTHIQIYEIKIRLNNIEGETWVSLTVLMLIVYLRSLETLHRLRTYAESTYTRTPRDTVGNR